MSAYLINSYHIGQLAKYYVETVRGGHSDDSVEAIAQLFAQANLDSIYARYPQSNCAAADFFDGYNTDADYIADCRAQAAQPGDFKWHNGQRGLANVIKGTLCYDYQACEVPNYYATQAAQLTRQIMDFAASGLAGLFADQRELDPPEVEPGAAGRPVLLSDLASAPEPAPDNAVAISNPPSAEGLATIDQLLGGIK